MSENETGIRLASRAYARAILRQAGRQLANRQTIVWKRAARAPKNESNVPVVPTIGVGAITTPDWRYTGPANLESPSDPHEALFPVCIVETVLMWHAKLRPVFEHVYVRDRADDTRRALHNELISLVVAEIGFVNADEEDHALMSYRLARMQDRKEKMVKYVLKSNSRRSAMES